MKMKLGNMEREVTGAAAIQKLKNKGYKEIDVVKAPEKSNPEPEEGVNLEGMTVEELKAVAKEKGIAGASALKKDELLALLKDVITGE